MAGSITDIRSPGDRLPAERRRTGPGCGDDPRLRAEVESLLRAGPRTGSSPACSPPGRRRQPVSERPGDIIGPYKLLESREGGFGTVFMADQHTQSGGESP
jgi:hypothetical protein